MILCTERLMLRGPTLADLPAMFATFSDPQVMRYWSTAPHADISVTREVLTRHIAGFAASPEYFHFERDGRWIGCGGHVAKGEIGFILSRDQWRQGVGREAMQAIIPHLFETVGLDYLTADADPLNAASVGLLTALGFHETHRAKDTFCINGVWSDSVYFRMDRSDMA